jgi:membrane fusion protein (multidrug efflux system)
MESNKIDAKSDQAVDAAASVSVAKVPKKTVRERLRLPLIVAFPVLIIVAGIIYYIANEGYVSTDDAFVYAAKESVNARVSGQVVKIAVKDNQRVKKGQLLFRVDPEPYRIAVEQAEAVLGDVRLQIEELKATYHQQLAELQSAKASATFADDEYKRKKALLASDFASKSACERAETDFEVAQQDIISTEQQIANTVAALDGDPDIEVDRHRRAN